MSGKKKRYGDWIRPEVRVPENERPVLLSPKGFCTIAAVGCYRNGEFYLHSPVLGHHYSIKVEGWMELPMTISAEMTAEILEKMGARE